MVVEAMILGASAKIAKDALEIEYLKSKQLELTNEEKQQILQDDTRRFVHFTSEKSAKEIIKSGFLIPTKGALKNHYTKTIDGSGKKKNSEMVYMFDSANFSVDDYIRNLPKNRSPFNGCYEYYAVTTKPDEYEINNFKRRAQDGAITYEGRLDIDGTDTRIAKYVLELDEEGKYSLVEKPMDFKYEPTQELKDKLAKDKMGMFRFTLATYMSDVRKTKTSFKQFKLEKEEYKEQLQAKKDFAKANKQFKHEQKDKNYIFEKDGRTIVVKNVEYEMVGGKKLQKLAIIENSEHTKKKRLQDCTKYCYMDEYNLDTLDSRVATEYFFGNLDNMKERDSKFPEYIGLPLEDLETGEVVNEYDTTVDKTFKQYMDRRQQSKDSAQQKYNEMQKNKKLTHRIKNMFSKMFGKRKNVKLLSESNPEQEDKQKLTNPGYSSVQAINNDDKDAIMFKFLSKNTNTKEEIAQYDNEINKQVNQEIEVNEVNINTVEEI